MQRLPQRKECDRKVITVEEGEYVQGEWVDIIDLRELSTDERARVASCAVCDTVEEEERLVEQAVHIGFIVCRAGQVADIIDQLPDFGHRVAAVSRN